VPTLSPTTNVPTSTSSVTLDRPTNSSCLEVLSELPAGEKTFGTLVFESLSASPLSNLPWFLDLEKGTRSSLTINENEALFDFKISPSKQSLAFQKEVLDVDNGNMPVERWLVITDSSGKTQKEIPFLGTVSSHFETEGDWLGFSWLDDTTLIIDTYTTEETEKLLLLDLVSEEHRELDSWGDYYDLLDGWRGKIFNSKLTQMVYPGLTDDWEYSIVLWDMQSQQVVVNVPTNITANAWYPPVWSPDDTKFTISLSTTYHLGPPWNQELFTINRDGQMTRLTYLTEQYDEVYMGNYNWSPDGRYIAFWWDDTSIPPYPGLAVVGRLAVVDTYTNEFIDYCIPVCNGGDAGPYWSPDGRQVVVQSCDVGTEKSRVVIVDIVQGYAVQIGEKMGGLIGWMASSQE
jgi:hypothetical protein